MTMLFIPTTWRRSATNIDTIDRVPTLGYKKFQDFSKTFQSDCHGLLTERQLGV